MPMDGLDDLDPNDPALLVTAIGHEVGNHLNGIRLQAHFLDEDLDVRALATSSVEIDALAGRAGALLALLRPVLKERPGVAAPVHWMTLLVELQKKLGEEGTRGIPIEIGFPETEDLLATGVDGFHSLVDALVSATLERLEPSRPLRIRVEPREKECALVIEASGSGDDLSGQGGLRGRSLVLAIGRRLMSRSEGRIEVVASDSSTTIGLVLPNA